MIGGPTDDSRSMELEIKVAYLEKLVGELDTVVQEQAVKLAALARDLERQPHSPTGAEVPDEKPPHY
jgi:uncharacterized coiled-coil protein SlyX